MNASVSRFPSQLHWHLFLLLHGRNFLLCMNTKSTRERLLMNGDARSISSVQIASNWLIARLAKDDQHKVLASGKEHYRNKRK